MGGRPIAALNIAGWPREELPLELLGDVLRGGLDIATRGGFAIVGGHTIDDPEPKYGMVVIGRADPGRLMTIDKARPGDVLVLTKPVGTGIITTAVKAGAAPPEVIAGAVASMTHLNDVAARVFVDAGVRACTDVTGFGLLGHLQRMLDASNVGAEIDAAAVPVLPGALELLRAGHVPGGTRRNVEAAEAVVEWIAADDATRILLSDAQTSGGLLGACPADAVDTIVGDLATEPSAAVVGRVVERAGITVRGSVG
jgi:selenide,water dikinase